MASILTLLLFSACSGPGPDTDLEVEDLAVTLPAHGPYGVGYSVEDLLHDPGDGPRTNRLAVWYPTDETSGAELRYQGVFPAPGVIEDAAPANGPFPLVVFSHGHQGYAEASARIVSHLVSHGYVVASPDHTGNTAFDGSDRDTSIFWHRPRDISAVIDRLTTGHALASAVSNDPIVALGHSFGGYTTHALGGATYDTPTLFPACASGADTSDFCSTMTPEQEAVFEAGLSDPRIAAIVTMAPGNLDLFTPAGLGTIDVPVLHMTGGLDNPERDDTTWGGLDRAGNLRVHLSDGGHNIFSDVASGLDTGPEYIDPEVGWPAIGAYWIAWIRALHGDEAVAPVLDGTLVFGPTTEVTVGSE